MQYPSLSKNHPFLNRLALTTGSNETADPGCIIAQFFNVGNITEMKTLFADTCQAALTQQYSWQQGCPGNLLYFFERLELLVEACFIIYCHKKRYRKMLKKWKRHFHKRHHADIHFPCMLSAAEISNPFVVVQSFFKLHSIKEWKQTLYAWMEAGLSDYDVLQSIEAPSILTYHQQLQKLMDACWCINAALKKQIRC